MKVQKELYMSKSIYEDRENCFKVKFNWSNQSIDWFLESERNTEFYNKIIEELEPFIKDGKTVLDIGCGVGSFSVEFAKRGYEVTAIDKSNLAIEALNNRIKRMEYKNIETLNNSYEEFTLNQNYDIVFISYMMGLINEENLSKISHNVNKHLILVLPFNKTKNDFSIDELYIELNEDIKKLEQQNYLDIINILNKMNKNHSIKKVEAEYGQMFATFEEAIMFIYHYFNLPIEKRNEAINWLQRKLIYLNDKFYLPNLRESVIIIL